MENLKNCLVLFDVDGTLTEARQRIDKRMLESLKALSFDTEIGLLTGSGLDYIKEQLWPLLADHDLSLNCHILPCNGIEYYIPNPDSPGNFIEIHRNSMWQKLGFEKFQFVMKTIMKLQSQIAEADYDISFTGHHIQNRGSTINWSPIGRNAINGERQQFKAMDKLYGIRRLFIHKFRQIMLQAGIEDVTIKLGGDTSFDIYPKGWDKRYALKHFPEESWDVFFVGDRCNPDGNDYEIFEHLSPEGRSFETSGPDETIEIIDIHLHRLIGNLNDHS
jgi:phosphomannomutase|tara:strand:- start:367 stop:1194 length:828 start_codon:yes stop_codon:yes gene_type:complete